MAYSRHISVVAELQDNLASERSLTANARNSIAKGRRLCKDSIQRIEDIIAAQEDRLAKLERRRGESPLHTDSLRASMKDSLTTYRLTLQQIRQSAATLEPIWAMFQYESGIADS